MKLYIVLAGFLLLTVASCSNQRYQGQPIPQSPPQAATGIPLPPTSIPNPTRPPVASSITLYVCVDTANIRSGPGTNYAVRKQLTRGQSVAAYQKTGEWYYLGRDVQQNDYYAHQSVLCDQPTASGSAPRSSQPQQSSACPSGCTEQKAGCDIKGNVSFDTGEKIYHVPGGGYYDATVINPRYGERWFCTEAEAVANGWRRSSK